MKTLMHRLMVPLRPKLRAILPATAAIIALVAFSLVLPTPAAAANKSRLSAYQHGSIVNYLPCPQPLPKQSAVLMGGGVDVASAYSWMIAAMNNCGGTTGKPGNFLVLRAGGNPSYDSYIAKLGTVAAVITLVVPDNAAANDPALADYINNAGAIWMTGGDQGDYYNFWKDSLLEKLVASHVNANHIPIGGTSAGMMILSQFNYIADPYSVTSAQALANPYLDGYMTLKRDFWSDSPDYGTPFPPLTLTVTDSHFDTRDRMGRLVAFLARVIEDRWASAGTARAIGVDQQTALAMEYDPANPASTWSARIFANDGAGAAAYLLSASPKSRVNAIPGMPLTFTNIKVRRFQVGGTSDYQLNVVNGQLSSSGNGGALY